MLFPNLVAYSKWSSVSVYSPQRHLLRLDELTPALVADNLMARVTFVQAVLRHDPSSHWVSVNANQLPPSGSSVFHPHLQGSANPVPTTLQRRLATLGRTRVREYLELEQQDGERLIGSSGRVAVSGAPQSLLVLRLVARAYFGPLLRSDAMWSERLHWEAATDLAPERVAEHAREFFA